ncbi:xylulokinase [Bradyrhizobium ottawaense]|uniref:Xylulose kinase n=1 Tax=Bradyrhizobium ottawaense TaxID=931866 RepID=A0ABV4FRK3_9BRAD|nr:xylulokinase [Bradyrhizobium ottawaense]BBO09642.1 xylulokinase [Bradyrhizobium sp. TM102]GMO19826.1 xylulokinase [Bradyrhizobium ottawaense]GMO22202.1 xylulokinase [Bradyrhizobium ottawaense]GMO33238.1 xylulokinase [Bradyrhizobium ottawaense]
MGKWEDELYLGLDIGTSGVKAVLVSEGGAILATAARELALSHPAPLWSEQDPDSWVDAAIGAVDDLAARHPREVARVRGIGLSGQMHGATLLDENGRPLRPAILWNDGRSQAECAVLEQRCPSLHAMAGNLAMPGFTAPKLLWVARHEPKIFARVAKVLLPKAYVRYRLTGELIEDMSDAAGTLWLDVGLRRWSPLLLHATGLDLHHMPRLVEGREASAMLAPEFTRRWGMAKDVVVAGGAGDNAASAIGLGAIAPGDAFLSLGTSGVVFRVTDRFAPAPETAVHAFCHALPGLWHQMGVMLSAAASLAWLAGVMETPAAALLAPLGERVDGPSPIRFLPYLDGERTPHNDAAASGAFVGLRGATGRTQIVQAVLEGVAFAARDNLAALSAASGPVAELDLVGGGSRSPLWAQICADVLGIPVHRIEEGEVGAALGAARLGRLAVTGETPAAVCTRPRRLASFTPRASVAEAYDEAYRRWRALYPALKETP